MSEPEHISQLALDGRNLPSWAKLFCLSFGLLLIILLVYCARNPDLLDSDGEDDAVLEAIQEERVVFFPKNLPTVWPDITVSVNTVARLDHQNVLVEWRYHNHATHIPDPFAWGYNKPNWAARTQVIDANGARYPVKDAPQGERCSNTNRDDGTNWSKPIYGGHSLGAWAVFNIPVDAPLPYQLKLQGLDVKGVDEVEVPVLDRAEFIARSRVPYPTEWAGVYTQLLETKKNGHGLTVTWKYMNVDSTTPFSLEPGFVSMTTVYDLDSGTRHRSVATALYTAKGVRVETGPTVIAPGTHIVGEAKFQNVRGSAFEIEFCSAFQVDPCNAPEEATVVGER